ncbi:MAG: hypothetical protein IKM87_02030 [Clostridia bacterium]|nr:hypothetical protein [Clostridia bacterium]
MVKTINLDGGKELKLAANAATPFRYKQLFGGDLLQIFQQSAEKNQEAVLADVVSQLAFIMNRQAEGVNMNTISEDEFYSWLENFEPMELVLAGQAIIDTYLSSTLATVDAKKK